MCRFKFIKIYILNKNLVLIFLFKFKKLKWNIIIKIKFISEFSF